VTAVNIVALKRPEVYLWTVPVAFSFICRDKIVLFRIGLKRVAGAWIPYLVL